MSNTQFITTKRGCAHLAILIENKVDAAAQPEQASRYQIRGHIRQLAGDWTRFKSCIVAPEHYLETDSEAKGYDARVSYEDIKEWLKINIVDGRRKEFRIQLLTNAIEQSRRGRTKHHDDRIAACFRDYWELVEKEFPELRMRRNDQAAAGNNWPEFVPDHLKDKYTRVRMYHKVDANCVDVELTGLQPQFQFLSELNTALLEDGVRFMKRCRTTFALTMRVPAIDQKISVADQLVQAREALEVAAKLANLFRRFRIR